MVAIRMAAALGRPYIIAFAVLVLIWTMRWRWSELDGDLGWVKGKSVLTSTTKTTTTTAPAMHGLGHQLPTDIDLSDPDAPFIGWPLQRACAEVESWVEGAVFLCDNNFGGVGNVRNFILTCIRYAIEAGASGIVMPRIRKRQDDDIAKIMEDDLDFVPFSYLFDEENFRAAMAENCPQITIYDTWNDIPHVRLRDDGSGAPEVEILDPQALDRSWPGEQAKCDLAELDHHTDRFHYKFRAHLQNTTLSPPPSALHPRLFRGTDYPGVLWEFPVYHDGPELANTFGGLCKFNADVLRLGKTALSRMHAYARAHDAKTRAQGGSWWWWSGLPRGNDAFLGIHLRTEADRMAFWPTYEDQERAYLTKAAWLLDGGLGEEGREGEGRVAYVASGNLSEAHKLAAAALEGVGLTVVSKDDVLSAAELEELHAMSWDQQGLVDYVVLTGAEYFMGNGRSSFSISVTKKRHLRTEGLYSRPYKVRPYGYGTSFIVGPMEMYYDHWLFIWDAMWP